MKGPDPKGGTTPKANPATPPPIPPLEPAAFDQLAAADPDSDGDGIPRSADKCPDEPEDLDKFQDSDGCPDPDNDLDGVADAVDKCPLKKETVNGVEDEDGCPDEGAADVVKTGSSFELKKAIFSSRFCSGVISSARSTWNFHVFPNTVSTGTSAATSACMDGACPHCSRALRVEPKAAIRAFFNESALAASKNLASRGFDPGQPPSI